MALSVQEFWQLVVASGLHDEESCRRLADAFATARESGAVDRAVSLPEWMLSSGEMSRYQAKILLAGKPGPFVYGDYLVTDRLEVAGLPGLFRALHRPTGTNVTLYFLSGALADPVIVTRLTQEAREAAILSRGERASAYLTYCHTLADVGAYKFLVLDELPGTTLADRLARRKTLAAKEAFGIACQVAIGLSRYAELHQAHGAVRPTRIWLTPEGTVRLATFPLARDSLAVIGAHASVEVEDDAIDYCAPELAAGEVPTPHGDIYGLGCVFYQMLSGRVPFPNGDRQQRLDQHRQATPQPLDEIIPALPKPLVTLVARMLAKKPEDRAGCMPALIKQFEASFNIAQVPATRAKLDEWLSEHAESHVPLAGDAAAAVPILFNPLESDVRPTTGKQVKRGSRRHVPMIAGIAVAILIAGGAAAYFLTAGVRAPQRFVVGPAASAPFPAPTDVAATPDAGESTSPAAADTDSPVSANDAQPMRERESASSAAREAITALDGTMWASPTQGAALDLTYLAPGAEVIVALRPAQFAANPEVEKLLDPRTLGALGEFVAAKLPELVAAPLEKIDEALVGALDSSTGVPRLAVVIKLVEPQQRQALLQAWGDPKEMQKDGVTYYLHGDRAFWLPGAEQEASVIVIGSAELIVEEVIPAGENSPAISRDIEELLAASDRDRDVTILAAPGILQTGSRDWFPGSAARLRPALDWFLSGHEADAVAATEGHEGAPVQARSIDMSSQGLPPAVMASAHLSDADLFLELRIALAANQPVTTGARALQERMARLSKRASEYIRALDLSDYSRDVLFDFPLMVEQLGRHTVLGTSGREVVMRTYLPSVAAHNLALGARLALAEQPRSAGAAAPRSTVAKPATAEPLAQRLDRKISLVFDRATLEKALQMVGEEIGADVVIQGADLQLEGITKNQSFGLAERDQPAREILQKIMLRANPDGKLIYVIRGPASGGGETLVITTRASARQRGEAVPAEFAEQP